VEFSTIWSDTYHRISASQPASSNIEDGFMVLLESAALFHISVHMTLRSLENIKESKGRKGNRKGNNCNY